MVVKVDTMGWDGMGWDKCEWWSVGTRPFSSSHPEKGNNACVSAIRGTEKARLTPPSDFPPPPVLSTAPTTFRGNHRVQLHNTRSASTVLPPAPPPSEAAPTAYTAQLFPLCP